jgi:hypothetical protein
MYFWIVAQPAPPYRLRVPPNQLPCLFQASSFQDSCDDNSFPVFNPRTSLSYLTLFQSRQTTQQRHLPQHTLHSRVNPLVLHHSLQLPERQFSLSPTSSPCKQPHHSYSLQLQVSNSQPSLLFTTHFPQ